MMTFKKFTKALDTQASTAFISVWKKNGPEFEIVPMLGGKTHVDLKDDIIYVSALQFDHFLQKMMDDPIADTFKCRTDELENAFSMCLAAFVLTHEFIHIKYKNDDLSEDIINEKTFDILRERNDIGEDMIEQLKGVF